MAIIFGDITVLKCRKWYSKYYPSSYLMWYATQAKFLPSSMCVSVLFLEWYQLQYLMSFKKACTNIQFGIHCSALFGDFFLICYSVFCRKFAAEKNSCRILNAIKKVWIAAKKSWEFKVTECLNEVISFLGGSSGSQKVEKIFLIEKSHHLFPVLTIHIQG